MATTSLWDIGEKTSDASSQSVSAPSTKTLTGTWIATPADDEAFALEEKPKGLQDVALVIGHQDARVTVVVGTHCCRRGGAARKRKGAGHATRAQE